MAEQSFAQDFRPTGDRNGVPASRKGVGDPEAPWHAGGKIAVSLKIDNKFDEAGSLCR